MNDLRQTLSPFNKGNNDGAGNAEKRSWDRALICTDIYVTPLDEDLEPLRGPFRGRTKDISTNGISFFHATPFHSKFVVLTITLPNGNDLDLMFEVVRTNDVPGGRFFTAGVFVKRLSPAN